MRQSTKLFAGAAILLPAAIALAPAAARATPYAYASNQITGLTITNADGTPLSNVISATTNVADGAAFTGSPSAPYATVAGTVGNALTIAQAYSGPGPTPAATFNAVGPGNFTGARGDAAIGAGNASSGGVSVSNVGEGYGAAVGNSTGNNFATITFQVTGTGQGVKLSFTDLAQLIASTAANAQETASATISDSFSVTAVGGALVASYAPMNLNQTLSSQVGTPPTNSYNNSSPYTFTTPSLAVGTTYNITLSSGSVEAIQPGTTRPVPEPATLGLLGAGLLGLGFVSRRKRG